MREILFRGKREDNGEWVYGWLGHLHCHNPQANTISSVYFTEITEGHNNKMNIIVGYKTVGQYTGLIDKNGKKIFEGDIIKIYLYEPKGLANYEVGCIKYDNTKARFVFCTKEGNYSIDNSNAFEVIGNIHDNPDLLKGGE